MMEGDLQVQVHVCIYNGWKNHICEGHPTRLEVAAVSTHAFRWMVAPLCGHQHNFFGIFDHK